MPCLIAVANRLRPRKLLLGTASRFAALPLQRPGSSWTWRLHGGACPLVSPKTFLHDQLAPRKLELVNFEHYAHAV